MSRGRRVGIVALLVLLACSAGSAAARTSRTRHARCAVVHHRRVCRAIARRRAPARPAPSRPASSRPSPTTPAAVPAAPTPTAPTPASARPATPTPPAPSPPAPSPPATAPSPPASASPQPVGVTGSWTLAFDDEFGGSSLDLRKWQPNWLAGNDTDITKPDNSDDVNCMDPAQVGVSGGTLALTAVQRPCTANNGATYGYASGLVNTYHSFTFTYGYVEARIFLPAAGGTAANFPAFWADGTGDWPSTGELDVMEVLGDCLGYHFHSPLGAFGDCAQLGSTSGWHTFGADWQPGVVTYYYDGQRVGEVTAGITGSPMYLILNNSVDPSHGGPTLAPAAMQVDYVRVWR